MQTKQEFSADILHWFDLHNGVVHWITRTEAERRNFIGKRLRKLKVSLEGKRAGARPVHGRGWIVHCSGCRLLSVDIRDARLRGYEWPWEAGLFGSDLTSTPHDMADVVRATWKLDGTALVWARENHVSRPIGAPVLGAELSGPRGRFITTGDVAFLMSDVMHLLQHGEWPWEAPQPACAEPVLVAAPIVYPGDDAPEHERVAYFDARIAALKASKAPQTFIDWD